MPALASPAARLLVDWLNERWSTSFAIAEEAGETAVASDGEHRLAVYAAPLWEDDAAWDERLRATESRLGEADGPLLLWVPPQAGVPSEEPAASDFVERVRAIAATLEPGARAEVTFPVTVRMVKTRDEGGYASVMGGLSRWWTRITENVQGTYQVDSSDVHRLTHDGDVREQLWETIGRLSHGVELGKGVEFEVEEAWTLQRLRDGEPGYVLAGAPPGSDPTEGIAVRRTVRRRLQAANEALAGVEADLRAVALVGAYEYGELETAGATVKAVDPSLFSRFEVVCVLADGDVRPTFLPRALPWV